MALEEEGDGAAALTLSALGAAWERFRALSMAMAMGVGLDLKGLGLLEQRAVNFIFWEK